MPVESVIRTAREHALTGKGYKPFGYPYEYGEAYGKALVDRSRVRRLLRRFGELLVYRATTDRSRRAWNGRRW